MSLANVPHSYLQNIISHLDQALYNHKEWYRLLLRSLVCSLPCDSHDLSPAAHKQCRFGQWYYNDVDEKLTQHPRFIAIGKEHERMHDLAKQLLTASAKNVLISTYKYDNFSNSLERFQLEMFALKHELEELVYYHDPLTNAINRLYMLPMLQEQQELVKRQVYYAGWLVMIDLDLFSKINNTYGHIAGDKVLTAFVQFLLKNIRSFDKVFRYGGEEFLLFLQNINLDIAYKLIERLRTGLEELDIDVGDGKTIHITASFGLAPLDQNQPIEQTIDQADKAVYAAKAAGRNCTIVWDSKEMS